MVERSFGNFGGGGGRGNSPNWNSIFSMTDISEKTRTHLVAVYLQLLFCTGSSILGAYLNRHFLMEGFFALIASIAVLGYCGYQVSNRQNPEDSRKGFLYLIAFFMGFLIGPAMHIIQVLEPVILRQAAVYTTTAFSSFSGLALFSRRRSFLFLGGIIMTLLQGMLLYSMFGWLTGNAIGLGYIMVSLFVACLWIIYDTQVIVEQSEQGDRDVPNHAMMLFVDLFDLFVKIVRVLIEMQDSDKKKKKK